MSPVLAVLIALAWHPSADWTERPDPSASPYARRGGVIRFSGAQPPKSFNGYVDNSSYAKMAFDLQYENLLAMDAATQELEPALARRWAVSDDGREFTFEIDARARWSDGEPVGAADVKWTFDAVMDPKSDTGPWKAVLGFFESPEVVDARTVRFRKKGDSPRDWRDILNCATFWVLPAHAFAGRDFNTLDFTGAVVGGPYRIRRVDEQVELELERHGRWWRQDLPACRGLYNFDRILIRYFADNENGFEAFMKRKLDVYPVYSARIWSEGLRGRACERNWIVRRRVRNHAPVGFQGFAMNMRRPPFDDRRVRLAMAHLIDREKMNRTMMNGAYFLQRSYYEDLYDGDCPCPNPLVPYDPAAAVRLLAEAGWRKSPEDGRLRKDGRAFDFVFLSRAASEDKFLALFDRALRDCGIGMSIVRKDFAGWAHDVDSFNFDMTWASWGAGVVKYPEIAWLGAEADREGSNNVTGFRSDEVDRLIAEEKGLASAEDRIAAYRRMDALIAAETPYALLWNTDSVRLAHWNRFGMPPTVLSRCGREEDVLAYWWYDDDRVAELESARAAGGFLPAVPEEVSFDAAQATEQVQ